MARRSIGFPLTLGIVLTLLVVALAVGWQLQVLSGARRLTTQLTSQDWLLLILGAAFSVLIIGGLAWLCVWLVREMRVNQRQRAFLDAVTHEMKTPLASLRLYVDTLLRHDPDAGRRREFLDRMDEDLERLGRTVDQVLSAAKAEERGRPIRHADVALPALLGECIAEIRARHELPDTAVSLHVTGQADVRADAGELNVVFRNLLDNAVKYSDEPVKVNVRVESRSDGRVNVDISDRGVGIPARELRKIFQRFYRAGRDVQRTASGLGLGLFIVRSLVRRQGGRVVARSEGSGAGSRFVVTLRAAPQPARVA